jgi:hypothetical protein
LSRDTGMFKCPLLRNSESGAVAVEAWVCDESRFLSTTLKPSESQQDC